MNSFRLNFYKFFYNNLARSRLPKKPPYKHIVQVGDPILRQTAIDVDLKKLKTNTMIELFSRLDELMKISNAVGLAAPQIGFSFRIFAMRFPDILDFWSPAMYELYEMEPIPFEIWVNPVVKIIDYDKVTFEETCESMRGFSAEVPRFKKVHLTGYNHKGEAKSREASGWTARLIQHEMDHLNGIFYTDLMKPKTLSCCNWADINRYSGRVFTTYIPGK